MRPGDAPGRSLSGVRLNELREHTGAATDIEPIKTVGRVDPIKNNGAPPM
jgi:hypothetical protein